MKSFAIIGTFLAGALAQLDENAQKIFTDLDKGKTREQLGHKLVPGGTAPQSQQLLPRFTTYHPDVKRTKVRYGPYKLPSTTDPNNKFAKIIGEPGIMTSMGVFTKPCASGCNIVTAQAGLEYANGTVADNSNGAWLHHIVLFTSGAGHKDGTCPGSGIGMLGERTFSSGNERTPTAFGDVVGGKVKSAFPLAAGDTFMTQLELMNLNEVVKSVYVTIDWEYIPGAGLPKGFKRARAMWLDITPCGISSVIPKPGEMKHTYPSKKWTVGYSGEMLGVGGHLHDGGVVLNVYKNQEKVCASQAIYGMGGSHGHGRWAGEKRQGNGPISADGKAHIRQMTTCKMMGAVKPTDQIWIDAEYDYNKHEGMRKDGKKDGSFTEIMGIAIMYLAADS